MLGCNQAGLATFWEGMCLELISSFWIQQIVTQFWPCFIKSLALKADICISRTDFTDHFSYRGIFWSHRNPTRPLELPTRHTDSDSPHTLLCASTFIDAHKHTGEDHQTCAPSHPQTFSCRNTRTSVPVAVVPVNARAVRLQCKLKWAALVERRRAAPAVWLR